MSNAGAFYMTYGIAETFDNSGNRNAYYGIVKKEVDFMKCRNYDEMWYPFRRGNQV
jgi:hypothetical protein